MLKLIEGDLFKTSAPVIVHGCNCFCTMGAGVAMHVADRYPEALAADRATKKGDRGKLGGYSFAYGYDGKLIVNLYSQYTFWDKHDMFDQGAFHKGLDAIVKDVEANELAMPAIGLGLANGNPDEVFQSMSTVAKTYNKTILLYVLDRKLVSAFRDWELNRAESLA